MMRTTTHRNYTFSTTFLQNPPETPLNAQNKLCVRLRTTKKRGILRIEINTNKTFETMKAATTTYKVARADERTVAVVADWEDVKIPTKIDRAYLVELDKKFGFEKEGFTDYSEMFWVKIPKDLILTLKGERGLNNLITISEEGEPVSEIINTIMEEMNTPKLNNSDLDYITNKYWG